MWGTASPGVYLISFPFSPFVIVCMLTKEEIRKKTLARRTSLQSDLKMAMDAAVRHQIEYSGRYQQSACVAMYFPIHGEVDLLPMWMGSNKTVVFPRVEGDAIVFCPARTMREFAPGVFKIHEPQTEPICIDQIDLILVPGLIFDRTGLRLGYGMGFYDRLLKAYPDIVTMGVCQEEFFVETLPKDSWDARVKYVATQSAIYKTEGEVS